LSLCGERPRELSAEERITSAYLLGVQCAREGRPASFLWYLKGSELHEAALHGYRIGRSLGGL
jgi:hypothetical protein